MRDYIAGMVDLTGDSYLNPAWNGHYRDLNQITEIAVHHDASFRPHDYDSIARYRSEAQGHYDRLGPGLQYHYKIDNTGVIFKIRPHEMWLYAVGSQDNVYTINICIDGCFEGVDYIDGTPQEGTREQFEALKQLLDNLCTQHPEFPAVQTDVYPHRYFSSTACPGSNLFPWVDSYRNSGGNIAIPDVTYDWPEFQPQINPTPTPPKRVNEDTSHDDGLWRVFVDGKQVGAFASQTNAFKKAGQTGVVKYHGQVVQAPAPDPVVSPPTSDAASSGPAGAGTGSTPTPPTESKTPNPGSDNTANPYQPGATGPVASESGNSDNYPMLTIPVLNTIIRSIKDFFTMSNSGKLRSRKFWLTVAANVIAIAGALLHYFSSTQTATLAGAATVVYVIVNGWIEKEQVKSQ